MAIIGYARVSTVEQDLTVQLEALKGAGTAKLFHAKASGVSADNEVKLSEMIDYIREDDVVVVTKLDRLGRSLRQILLTIEKIHNKGASLRTLDNVIDTSNDSPIAKAMVNLIGTFAELERDLIISRTSEGRAKAVMNGVRMGPKLRIMPALRDEIRKEVKSGSSIRSIAKKYGIARSSVLRIRDEEEGSESG